jgi:hypothetical protein
VEVENASTNLVRKFSKLQIKSDNNGTASL